VKVVLDTPPIGTPSHDLLDSADRPDNPHNWEQGIAFVREEVSGSPATGVVNVQGPTAKSAAKTISLTNNGAEYLPFLVEIGIDRPVLAFTNGEVTDIARRAIERGTSAIVENRQATGSVAGNQYLTDSNVTTVTGTYIPTAAIGAIETRFAQIGGQGTIYVSPMVASYLTGDFLYEKDGKLYTITRDTLIVVGNYGNVGPGAATAAAGTQWIFGHLGRPQLFLSEVMVFDAFDQATNQPHARAERVAAVVWNPGQWATLAGVDDGV
jgi:hypothetical protein